MKWIKKRKKNKKNLKRKKLKTKIKRKNLKINNNNYVRKMKNLIK
jgi:uncharacterized membrane protein YcgQ (UPF0703/DUF1980 family)